MCLSVGVPITALRILTATLPAPREANFRRTSLGLVNLSGRLTKVAVMTWIRISEAGQRGLTEETFLRVSSLPVAATLPKMTVVTIPHPSEPVHELSPVLF